MARIAGLEKKEAPWHLRWFDQLMRKMFRKRVSTGQNPDAPARSRMGRDSDGSCSEPQATRIAALPPTGKNPAAARIGCPF